MELDTKELSAQENYKVLASLVVPRPIAWVSTLGKNGISNLAPYSFFNVMGVRPPIVAFAPGNKPNGQPKDTPRNIVETGEFVINLLEEEQAPQMVESAKPHAEEVSEFSLTGLTEGKSVKINAPRVLEAPVSLECKRLETLEIGGNRMIIGEVLYLHLKEGLMTEETLQLNGEYFPIGRMASPDKYCRTTDGFKLS